MHKGYTILSKRFLKTKLFYHTITIWSKSIFTENVSTYTSTTLNGSIINVGVWHLPISTFFITINKKTSKSPVLNNYTWRRCSYERPS